jgi:hypothetical protein
VSERLSQKTTISSKALAGEGVKASAATANAANASIRMRRARELTVHEARQSGPFMEIPVPWKTNP